MQQWYNRVITGEAVGVIPAVLRWLLSVVSIVYGRIMLVLSAIYGPQKYQRLLRSG